MPFLDRFKTQPRWKHVDPDVRLSGVADIEDDEQELLAAVAREDDDARVRRAAVLTDVVKSDTDAKVRDEAADALIRVAVGQTDPALALAALDALTDDRALAAVARGGAIETARRQALGRLTDARGLGSVARHADDAAIRTAALERLHDEAELAAVAIKTDHRDTGLAALDRVSSPDHLESIATRARQKAVSRRARALLRERQGGQADASDDGRRDDQARVCARLEALLEATDTARLADAFARAESEWNEVAPAIDESIDRRFAEARRAVEARLADLDRAARERDREARERAEHLQARAAICDELFGYVGDDAHARIEAARAAWAALPPLDAEAGASLEARFARAIAACEANYIRLQSEHTRHQRLAAIAEEAEQIAVIEDLEEAERRFSAIADEFRSVSDGLTPDGAVADRVERAAESLRARLTAAHDRVRRDQEANRRRAELACERLERLVGAPDLTLKQAERANRELRTLADTPPPLPSRREQAELATRVHGIRQALSPRFRELRDADDWQRWANVTVQEELIAKAEALAAAEDPAAIARELNELRGRWKAASLVPRERAEALWRRFKAAHDQARARCEAHFADQARERSANLDRKKALCEQVEALAESTDWIRTADQIKQLQAEWKSIGPVPRRDADAVWTRFRAACDRFFTRRAEDLARRKTEWAENLRRKAELCERVEALASPDDWDAAADQVRRSQAEWRTIGPVKKHKSEAIWQRFRTACDQFFERYRNRDRLAATAESSEREALCVELEQLVPAAGDAAEPAAPDPPDDLPRRVQNVRQRWVRLGPPRRTGDPLDQRYHGALARVVFTFPRVFAGSDLDPEASRRRMEQLCERIERLLPASAGPEATSPTAILAIRLREALASNTIGRVDEDARWRDAADEVRKAQSAWKRLGPVPPESAQPLNARFRRACDLVFSRRPKTATGARR